MTLIDHQRAVYLSTCVSSAGRASLLEAGLLKCEASHASGFIGAFVGSWGEKVNLSLGRTYTPSQQHHSSFSCFTGLLNPEMAQETERL